MGEKKRKYKKLAKKINGIDRYAILKNAVIALIVVFAAAVLMLIGARDENLILLLALFLMVSGLLMLIFAVKGVLKIKEDEDDYGFRKKIRNIILRDMLRENGCEFYFYEKETTKLYSLRSAADSEDDYECCGKGIEALVKLRGIDKDGERKLKNSIAIIGPDKNLELDVTENGVLYIYRLSCVKWDRGEKNVVVCNITSPDIPHSQQQVQINDLVCGQNTSGVEVFLERNNWRYIWNSEQELEKMGFGTELQMNYDVQLEKNIALIVKQEDRANFLKTLNRLALLEKFRNGVTDLSLSYKVMVGEETAFRLLDVRMYRDIESEEIKANFYVRSVDADGLFNEKARGAGIENGYRYVAMRCVEKLYKDCVWLGFADLDKDKIYILKSDKSDGESRTKPMSLKKLIDETAEIRIHPEDRNVFYSYNNTNYLKNNLTADNPITVSYRKKLPGSTEFAQAQSTAFLIKKDGTSFEVLYVEKLNNVSE